MTATDTPAQAAQRQLDAYNARDLEAFLAVYTEDCTVRAFPSGEVLMEGRDAMRERYGALFANHPGLHCRLLTRVEHEHVAIDHEEVEGLREDGLVYAVALYEVREGQIRNVWFIREDPSA
ncbi:MAG: nuclear transport factor 2 family protein [Planctomycetota bacterium]|nr:nuclear transport factor 2 family protein [Planctomycetota bacterium]